MIILGLDTTTKAGSAAVVRDGAVLHESAGDATLSHGQRLPADLMRVLDAAGVPLRDVNLFAVAAGPGSFTGLRVGIATVQGLAMAAARKVVAVSVLEALAYSVGGAAQAPAAHGAVTAAWMDAQRGQVFGALYSADGRVLAGPSAMTPAATLDAWRTVVDLEAVTFVGDGAARYADILREHVGPRVAVLPSPLLAGVIGRIAHADPSRAVLPHAVVPTYVRAPDAELARARQLDAT
jgi:tRNA threonylcarbamoyladenosine biosynthesis protein TsaB